MESFQGAVFSYSSRAESSMADASDHIGDEEEEPFSASLDVYAHHARNIHNICIYANQDVYAKFSLTCSPEEAVSTRIVAGGGKNPQFDERLKVEVARPDAVLKCEIWMLSRARNYLEDQLLGFALVPLSLVAAADGGELTQDFTLSSTDLFHSPAGSVRLTLSLDTSHFEPSNGAFKDAARGLRSSISSEVVILGPAVDYGAIEFPDMNIANENQKMVSEYFDMAAARGDGSSICREIGAAAAGQFLHLGAPVADHDMNSGSSDSPESSVHNSGPFSISTTTSLSDDRASADSDKKNSSTETHHNSGASQPDTPTSRNGGSIGGSRPEPTKLSNRGDDGADQGEQQAGGSTASPSMASVFAAPLGDINVDAEQSAMQQQIVDMYMKSMQQFTESLAKMKLPMDVDSPRSEDVGGFIIQSQSSSSNTNNNRSDTKKTKDGPRVFYGSRAFF